MAEEKTIGLVMMGIIAIIALAGLVILLNMGMNASAATRVHKELDILHGESEIVHLELDRLHEEAELIHSELDVIHEELDVIEGTAGITIPTSLHQRISEIEASKTELDNRFRPMYHRLQEQQDARIAAAHALN